MATTVVATAGIKIQEKRRDTSRLISASYSITQLKRPKPHLFAVLRLSVLGVEPNLSETTSPNFKKVQYNELPETQSTLPFGFKINLWHIFYNGENVILA
jgi:hypothetical protein